MKVTKTTPVLCRHRAEGSEEARGLPNRLPLSVIAVFRWLAKEMPSFQGKLSMMLSRTQESHLIKLINDRGIVVFRFIFLNTPLLGNLDDRLPQEAGAMVLSAHPKNKKELESIIQNTKGALQAVQNLLHG